MSKLVSVFLLLLISSCAEAGTSTPYGMGGNLASLDAVIQQANHSCELFRIEGHCQPACTMFLRIRNVCVSIAMPPCCSMSRRTEPRSPTEC
jgi:hypothetical protein